MKPLHLVAALLVLAGGLSACTTSRAALAWEDGWQAEARGDLKRAGSRYANAYSRNGFLVGAELNRLRLLARVPDKRAAVGQELDRLLAKRGEVAEVAIFGAVWALTEGDAKKAASRLDVVRAKIGAQRGCSSLRRDFMRADLQVAVAAFRWPVARRVVAQLGARCGTEAVPAATAALVAWNIGDRDQAAVWLGRAATERRDRGLLPALLALHKGDARRAQALLAKVDQPKLNDLVLVLRAHAALAAGDAVTAERLARRALAANPTSSAPQQLLGVALLRRGDAQRARDLFAGAAAAFKGTPPWTLSFDLALAELQLGHLEQARAGFETASRACDKGACEVAGRNYKAMVKLGL